MKKATSLVTYFCLLFAFSSVMAQPAVDQTKLKELVLQDAQKQGLTQSPEVVTAIRTAQEGVIIRAWERSVLASQPLTQDMKNQIYKELSAVLGDSEYSIFQVLLDSEEAANTLINNMTVNPKWDDINIAAVVKPNVKFSKNKSDWVNLSVILPEVRPAVQAMKVGEVIRKPVRSNSSWLVVGLIQKRPFVMPSAEGMDKDLVTLAERKIINQKLQSLLPK